MSSLWQGCAFKRLWLIWLILANLTEKRGLLKDKCYLMRLTASRRIFSFFFQTANSGNVPKWKRKSCFAPLEITALVLQTHSISYSMPQLLRKASFLEGVSRSYVWFPHDPYRRRIACQSHASFGTLWSVLATLTSTSLSCGNEKSNQIARFVSPDEFSVVLNCDTKKLTPCIFITITSEETTNLIEYVIAQGIEVGLGSLRCWSMGRSLNLFMGR